MGESDEKKKTKAKRDDSYIGAKQRDKYLDFSFSALLFQVHFSPQFNCWWLKHR